MEIRYSLKAQNDIDFWKRSGNMKVMNKITLLLESIENTPSEGIGKPEQLKHELTGLWSRRINSEHRIVYEVKNLCILVHSLRGHY